MNRLVLALALWIGLVGAGWARTIEEQLLSTLRAQGYEILEQGYTFLGRLRVVAQNGDMRREIVVNPGTGEILRDYAVMLPSVASTPRSGGSGGSNVTGSTGTAVASTGTAGNPSPTGGVGTTLGAAATDDPTVANEPGRLGTATLQTDGALYEGDMDRPEVILVDPILPFSAGNQ
jgi:hypothetical protein